MRRRSSERIVGLSPGGLSSRSWPSTPWSLIRDARKEDAAGRREALSGLLQLYYRPVQRFLVRVLRAPDDVATDLAHDLFVQLLERDALGKLTHETSLRGFLKVACRRRHASWLAAEGARRRLLRPAPERAEAEAEAAPALDDDALDAALDEELLRSYVEEAQGRLRAELERKGKLELLAVFEARTRFDGSRPEEYAALAERFGKRVYDIRNQLSAARKIFRRELLRIAGERADDPRRELAELGLLKYVE